MASHQKQFFELTELVEKLNKDRAWILEQLDRGSWPEFRPDLAALERELGQLLTRAAESLKKIVDFSEWNVVGIRYQW